ncbi:MAG: hypothetical protein KatS3mg107_1262 [Gemmataceae bacterium]|nr:MAG: hypothetical protein KatS3mg107_1262 [Gemmataceae bacterium]
MPLDNRYWEINDKLLKSINLTEQLAEKLDEYWCKRPDPFEVVGDNPLVCRMKSDISSALEGLIHPDAWVRLAALHTLGEVWNSPRQAAPIVRRLALTDPDREVQLTALGHILNYVPEYDDDLCRSLAEIALNSDDVMLRNMIYFKLRFYIFREESYIFSVKYIRLPILFDEEFVKNILESS